MSMMPAEVTRDFNGSLPPQRTYWRSDLVTFDEGPYTALQTEERLTLVAGTDPTSNLVGSRCTSGFHAPVIDIDGRAWLEQGGAPGYQVLTVDQPVESRPFKNLIRSMAGTGVIAPGHAQALVAAAPGRRQPPIHPFKVGLRVPSHLIPSSTEDHSHLFIDWEMPWQGPGGYRRLLVALARAGIIGGDFLSLSEKYQQSMVRKPGVYKSLGRTGVNGPLPPA